VGRGKVMRRLVVLLLLAATAASGGGCVTSTDSIADQGAPGNPGSGGSNGGGSTSGGSNGGGSTSGGGGTDPSSGLAGDTSGTGGPNAVTLASGDKALAFAPTGRSPTSGGLAKLTFANQGTSSETATVAIDPKNTLGWGGPTELGLYHHDANGLKDADLQTRAAEYRAADYSEYRKINTQTDEELQYWKFTDANGNMTSYAAQYRNVTNGGTKDAKAAWFFGGNATPAASLPTSGPSATYEGAFAATAMTDNWTKPDGWAYDPNGYWRLRGNAEITADFAAAKINGVLTPTYWEKYDSGNVVQITPGTGNRFVFHDSDVVLKGNINGNTISGASYLQRNEAREGSTTEQPDFVNGDNPMHGGFYGEKADNVTGVFATYARLPAPGGADTGINDDRRGTVDMQGMFNAQCATNCVK
jgi:C-lobe and N-lobe beta barrels of Tf-binding protein B